MREILKVKNLSVSFGKEMVLDNVSFSLKDRENLVVLGPNGSGKTILLKALLGMIPYKGEIKWADNLRIGYVPQKFVPNKNFPVSVEEFFKFKKINDNQILEALETVGLIKKGILKKTLSSLSSGQLQRVLIAWSLADNPEVLLFDEPTTGIDIGGEETVYNLLAKIESEKNLTIILITHDLNIVYRFADSVLCLNKRVICYGGPKDVLISENFTSLYGKDVKLYKHKHV